MADEISYARVKSDAQSAQSYSQRKQEKHAQEMAMLADAFAHAPGIHRVLDAPCGVGRASIWLAQQGHEVTGIDLGEAALSLARELAEKDGMKVQFESQDIFALPYENAHFDASLCFRLLHHFESKALQSRLIGEICRVSARFVVISRITPSSFTSLRRRLRKMLTGKAIKQYPVTTAALDAEFALHGFVPVHKVARSEFLHSLQVHVYRRE